MKINIAALPVFTFLLLASCPATAQENRMDAFMNQLVANHKLAGAAIAVLKADSMVFSKNYGLSDIENNIPVTDATSFNIMSVTKIFVAVAVMQLVHRQLVDLDAPVKKYLTGLPAPYDSVMIRQLLNHSAGVPDYVHVKGYMEQANRTQTPMEVLAPILHEPLDYIPGTKNGYSNAGYFLLGLLVEKVTGKSLGRYLTDNIFKPANMHDTYLEDEHSPGRSKAKGYTALKDTLKREIALNPSQYWAAGGIVSTKNDLVKLNRALQKNILLPASEITHMMQPSKLTNETWSEYGLGFELMNAGDMKVAGNNGAGVGYNASNLVFLNDGLTVIVLTNTSNGRSIFIDCLPHQRA